MVVGFDAGEVVGAGAGYELREGAGVVAESYCILYALDGLSLVQGVGIREKTTQGYQDSEVRQHSAMKRTVCSRTGQTVV